MKFSFAVTLAAWVIFAAGCSNKVMPLKQTYLDKPYEFSLQLPMDQVWSKLISALTKEGLSIKVIDKGSGLVTTENQSFLNSFAWETEDGSLTNSSALVVCSRVRGPLSLAFSLKPTHVEGQWTILINPQHGKTVIFVKLTNATGKVVLNSTYESVPSSTEEYNLIVKSLGTFERNLEQQLQ